MALMNNYIAALRELDFSRMYGEDFFLTWDKTDDELAALALERDAWHGDWNYVISPLLQRRSPRHPRAPANAWGLHDRQDQLPPRAHREFGGA